ncbi:hypothetical protein KY289_030462 [Solanum tuberosum]|nr:hypothetical protein KY289_030462 [Solanum tuberosum]
MEDDDECSAHETSVGVNESKESPQKKLRQLKSSVWRYFKKISRNKNEVKKAICRGCKEPYRVGSTPRPNGKNYGTSHLKRHLIKRKKVKFSNLSQMYMDQQGNIQSRKIDQLISREKLAEAIIEHDLPYSFVEYKKIRAWADYVYPELVMPSRNTSVVDVQKVYFREKEKLKQVLAKIPNRVCLTSDCWTTGTFEGYLCLTDQYIDDNWKENSSNLDEVIKEMAVRMFNKFQKYWNRYSLVLSFGAILDPRFKMQLLEHCVSKVNSLAKAQAATIKLKLYKLYEQYANNQIGATAPTTWSKPIEEGSQSKQKKFTFFAEFKEFEGTSVCIAGKSELDLYLEEKKLDYQTFHEMDVIKYWKDNEKNIPIFRNSIHHENVQTLVTTRIWLHGFTQPNEDEDELLKETISHADSNVIDGTSGSGVVKL